MKIIIITGTSSGLGKAIFDSLYNKNVMLICISRRFLSYQKKISKHFSNKIKLLHHDLSKTERLILKLVPEIFLSSGKAEEIIFINNAGMIEPIDNIGKLDSKLIIRSVNVNLIAPMLITNFLVKIGSSNETRIKILNISSGAASYPIDGWSVYCAVKAGSKMFFNVLEKQFDNFEKVSVYQIDPGIMNTNMQSRIREADKSQFPRLEEFLKFKEEGKLVEPAEVAAQIIEKYIQL